MNFYFIFICTIIILIFIYLAALGFSYSMWGLVPWPGIEFQAPWIGNAEF